ncbi:MAG: 23S rRNA (guanosine(2251)-2'-O)-methyltransferase RlmB [bacterium]
MPEIIYGRNSVLEALRAGQKIEKILIAAEVKGPKIFEILNQAKKHRVPIDKAPKKILDQVAGTQKSQGVVALVPSQPFATVEDILSRSQQLNEPPLLALLDGIEDPHNFGAILRAADGARVHGVILPKRRSVGLTSTVAKTSAGASAHVLIAQVSNLNYTIEQLKSKNIWIAGADQNADQIYYEAELSGPLGLVIGAEGHGLHRLVKEKCDFLVKIPMYGKINSLNASVAAALLFFEARRQRKNTTYPSKNKSE